MKKLILLALVASFASASASAFAGGKASVSCYTNLVDGSGYLVKVYEKNSTDVAVLYRYVPGGPTQYVEKYLVTETVPGAPLVFSTTTGNFVMNICVSCPPVDGKAPGTLTAVSDSVNLQAVPVFCSLES